MIHGFSEDFPRILGVSEIFFTIHGFSDNFDPQFSDSFLMHKKTLASFSGLKIAHDQTLLRKTHSAYKLPHKHQSTHKSSRARVLFKKIPGY